jgi:hypothetical protein
MSVFTLFLFLSSFILSMFHLNSSVFWDITLSSALEINRCFGGTICLYLQDRRISQARDQNEAGSKEFRLFIYFLFFSFIRTIPSFSFRSCFILPATRSFLLFI